MGNNTPHPDLQLFLQAINGLETRLLARLEVQGAAIAELRRNDVKQECEIERIAGRAGKRSGAVWGALGSLVVAMLMALAARAGDVVSAVVP
jgi:hypothetical protein